MITTFSKFYYGHVINQSNYIIQIDEGSGEVDIELDIGSYTLTEFAAHIQDKMREFGTQDYTVTVNRIDRLLTISAPLAFDFLFGTGTLAALSPAELMGFSNIDYTGQITYTSEFSSGKEYVPQFRLQDYEDYLDNQESIQAVVNESASGVTEVVSFGRKSVFRFNIKYITNYDFKGKESYILQNLTGIEDANEFMQYIIDKPRIEFMKDKETPNTFFNVYLESTPESKEGTSYKLKESESKKLQGFFDTGTLVFRKV